MKLITVHSLRGGAGRTTLALKKACEAGPSAVLIETSLAGTSLVDVLPLRAPAFGLVPEAPINLQQAPTGWLSIEESRARIEQRHRLAMHGGGLDPALPLCVPFLNDYLLFSAHGTNADVDPRALLWVGDEGGPRVIPASPLPSDQLAAEVLISDEPHGGFIENRLELLVASLLREGSASTIVFDTERGLRGVAGSVLSLALRLAHKRPLSEGGLLPRILEDTPLEVEVLFLCADDRRALDRWLMYCPDEDRALIQIQVRP